MKLFRVILCAQTLAWSCVPQPVYAQKDAEGNHIIKVAEFAKRHLTHVCTQGVVTYIKHEEDKDWHYRVEDAGAFIVAEVTVHTPLPTPFKPKRGDTVEVCGRRRYDDGLGHYWWEVNPVESGRVVATGKR